MSILPSNDPVCVHPDDERAIDLRVEGRPRDVGTITVARLLPSPKRQMVGPFIFLDHMGPVVLPPGVGFDIRPHPHIGLSTVTYFFAGENTHRDSLGTVQVNRPGDVNLMTAGRGIVHSERADPAFRATGGMMHGVQIWLALPDGHEDDDPSFEHHPEAALPAVAPVSGARGQVLIGSAFGARSPILHPSDPLLVDLALAPGTSIEIAADVPERALFVVDGDLEIGNERLCTNQLGVLCADRPVRTLATAATRALWIGGPPLGPRFIEWNFVSSAREKINRARDAWKAGQFPVIPTDAEEFIPWPE